MANANLAKRSKQNLNLKKKQITQTNEFIIILTKANQKLVSTQIKLHTIIDKCSPSYIQICIKKYSYMNNHNNLF